MNNTSRHPVHSMSSYLGSFPPKVPRRIIERWTKPNWTVLDPFCGAGTTLVEAKLHGRSSIGIDLNPLAVALARAKIQPVTLSDVQERLTELAGNFGGESELDDVPEDLEPIYHRRTLAQLCYLRRALDAEVPEDIFLRGCVLGIMHGKARRDGTTAYLSVDMPNTFSMSPKYVRSFVEKHHLQAPAADVFGKLRERSAWILRAGSVPEVPDCVVCAADATRVERALSGIGVSTVDSIVTSPPYLGILRYGAFNWIRLWFLGYDQYHVDHALQTTDSLDVYLSFMVSFLSSAAKCLEPGGIAALVIGDVREHGQQVQLGERVWEEIEELVPFELMELEVDGYDSTSKTTRVWGESKKGQATPLDRVLVLRRAQRCVRETEVENLASRSLSP